MRGVRTNRFAIILLLLACTFGGNSAFASTRADDGDGFWTRVTRMVVHIFEDVRMGFPPGRG